MLHHVHLAAPFLGCAACTHAIEHVRILPLICNNPDFPLTSPEFLAHPCVAAPTCLPNLQPLRCPGRLLWTRTSPTKRMRRIASL